MLCLQLTYGHRPCICCGRCFCMCYKNSIPMAKSPLYVRWTLPMCEVPICCMNPMPIVHPLVSVFWAQTDALMLCTLKLYQADMYPWSRQLFHRSRVKVQMERHNTTAAVNQLSKVGHVYKYLCCHAVTGIYTFKHVGLYGKQDQARHCNVRCLIEIRV